MRVHELIEILQKMNPNAEITVGSSTLKHGGGANVTEAGGRCEESIGVWPAIGVDTGEFPYGGPFGDGSWVRINASDAWGCTFVESQGIKRFAPVTFHATVRGVPANPATDPLWYTRHLSTCGSSFRGCDPECPKELAEKALPK